LLTFVGKIASRTFFKLLHHQKVCRTMATPSIQISSLVEKDLAAIWHPFTQMQTARNPIPIVRAKGVYLYTEKGERYIDGISSWWVNLHGHCHPYIVDKIISQLNSLDHVIFAGFTHPSAVELGTRLLNMLPGKMSKVFFSDNGSTSVEIALKMALQYPFNTDPFTKKTTVVCFKNSYHGDTFGAMSAAGKNDFNKPFWKHLFEVKTIDPPFHGKEEASLSQLKNILNKKKVACFIFEPLVLGAGGMRIYPPQGLDALLHLCKQHHVICIADEVMTGFGRTETLFACEQIHETPDIICLSKGLTGGLLPLGVTACTQAIFDAFLSDHLHQALLHGHSYTANPIACTSALASLDLLQGPTCFSQREMIAKSHQDFCWTWKEHPKLIRCESLGTLLALEYRIAHPSSYFQSISNCLSTFFLDKGVLLRPLGNILYVLPPYCIQQAELNLVYDVIIDSFEGL
jgi:adenosylmethionine-8-amino-7-oxononanoate aminotransferase